MRRHPQQIRVCLLALCACLAMPSSAAALAPGDALPGFVPTAATFGPVTGQESATSVVVQPDGKVLVAVLNDAESDRRIVRLLADGALDPSFGTGGVWHQPRANATTVRALALQPDGKIVFVGEDATQPAIVVGRLTSDGVLDSTFANDGLHVSALAAGSDPYLQEVIVEPTGVVSFAGIVTAPPKGDQLLLGRLRADGSDDPDFPGTPFLTFGSPVDMDDDRFGGLVRMPSGDYVLGASSVVQPPMIWRIAPSGIYMVAANAGLPSTLDTPMDVAVIDATHVAVLLAGSPIGAGLGYYDVATTPRLVPSASSSGTITPFPAGLRPASILRDWSGRYLVAGIIGSSPNLHRAIARLTPSGAIDATWGDTGVRVLDGISSRSWLGARPALGIGPDGSITSAYHVGAPAARVTAVDRLVGRMSRLRMTASADVTAPVVEQTTGVALRATNDGPDASAAGHVSFTLSDGLRLMSMTGLRCVQTSPLTGGCDIPALASGATRTITIRVRSGAAGQRTIRARVTAAGLDDVTADDETELGLMFLDPPIPASGAPASNVRLLLQPILRARGRVLRCGSLRTPCGVRRVRRGIRTAPAWLRVTVRTEGETAAPKRPRIVLEQRTGQGWMARRSFVAALSANDARDVALPLDWRARPGMWRMRATAAGAASSSWITWRVR